jgi:hypothetical protein
MPKASKASLPMKVAWILIQKLTTRLICYLKQCILHHLEHSPTTSHDNHHYNNLVLGYTMFAVLFKVLKKLCIFVVVV